MAKKAQLDESRYMNAFINKTENRKPSTEDLERVERKMDSILIKPAPVSDRKVNSIKVSVKEDLGGNRTNFIPVGKVIADEKKSQRVVLLMKPSVYAELKKEAGQTSFNSLVNRILEDHINKEK